jgi:1,4-dihydroxy-2-naphthoate octaprenyltransferase
MPLPALLKSLRPPFLLLTLSSVFLGYAVARQATAAIDDQLLPLVLAGALCAHASVNLFNEYFDFRSGLDLHTQRTPFSGGSGALPASPDSAGGVLWLAVVLLLLCILTGLYLAWHTGPGILLFGIPGVILVVVYTGWVTRYPWLCLLAPGLAFGPLMVTGTAWVLSGSVTPAAIGVSLVPFFLTNNLLLLNQYPDIEADRQAGRRHLLIVYGKRAGAAVYLLSLLLAFAALVTTVLAGYLPDQALIGLLCAGIAVPLAAGVWRHAGDTVALRRMLAPNVVLSLLMPSLVGLGLLL